MRKINLLILLFTTLSLMSTVTMLNASSKEASATHREAKIEQKTMNMVNVNTATLAQLQTLKRIGLKKAAAIVAYREQHGAFKSIDDLTNVKGMSQTIITANKGHLKVS